MYFVNYQYATKKTDVQLNISHKASAGFHYLETVNFNKNTSDFDVLCIGAGV